MSSTTRQPAGRPWPEPGRGQIGTNLRSLLGMHAITQRDLAVYLGLSAQGVWNIVHGRSEPRTSTAIRTAQAFAIDASLLCADTGSCLLAAAASYETAPVRSVTAKRSRGGAPAANS